MLFEFRRVAKNYGPHRIFKNLDFSLERSTFSVLTGASGSGKTTFFRMLSGIEKPSDGQILFLDRPLKTLSPTHLRQIGFIFQQPRGLLNETVFENLSLPLRLEGYQALDIEKKVFYWMDLLNLGLRKDTLFGALSGGEKQRVEFARALIRKPRLILADEPTAHLDSTQADHLMDILWDHYKQGATVFVSTHHPDILKEPEIRRFQIAHHRILRGRGSEESISSPFQEQLNGFSAEGALNA